MPYAESSGTRIYWEEEGAGEPLLLVMGLGYSHEMWHRSRPVLGARFRLILFDNRGVGKSDVPAGPYSIGQMAADAAAVLDAAGVESAHVFGMSMGGMIAQEFALQYPERVRKLVLGCTACGGPKAVRAEKEVMDVLFVRGELSQEESIASGLPFIYDVGTPRERIEEDLAIRRRSYPSGAAYMAQLNGILSWECYSRLPGIRAETLVIHGQTDRLVPAGNGKLIAETIPAARLVLLKNASHLFVTDQAEAAHRAISGFLGEPPGAPERSGEAGGWAE